MLSIFGANEANARLKGQFAGLEYVGVIHKGIAFYTNGFNHNRFLKDKKILICFHLIFAIWDI